ncbi:hypothetical protein H6P81_021419 [Aristolochia fimbriata]|uniref:Uncharacterized protein n=1 Tax=Aristolochia fimbriata TaxID=158543 RepID=A0AAV7DR14_ARIFI|nr:hypothetical protein H6P81_021419 [Aristolochia fimbriata]
MGSPLADAKSAKRCHEGTPARSLPPSSVTDDDPLGRDHPPGLVAPRTRRVGRRLKVEGRTARRPRDNDRRRDRVRAQRVVTLSGAPIPWDLRPSVAEDASADYTERAKSRRFSYWALPVRSPPLLGESFWCSHLTWGRIRARPPGHGGQLPGRGPLQSQGLDTHSSHAGPGRAEPPLSAAGCPWGKVFFSQPRQGGGRRPICSPPTTTAPPAGGSRARGGENTPGVTPRQVYPDLVASGATCAQRLDGSRDSAIHTKHRDFATLFIDARAKISAVESRVRLPCSRSDRPLPLSLGTDRAESGCSGVRPRPSRVADAEPAGRRSLTLVARDSTGACTRRAPPPLGIVVQLARLSRRFGNRQ